MAVIDGNLSKCVRMRCVRKVSKSGGHHTQDNPV